MWSIDEDRVCKRRTWWWWWWLLFLDDPDDPENPRQYCCFWVHRNCPRARIQDLDWRPNRPLRQRPDGVDFYGLACSWYYDGRRTHDPLFMVPGEMTIDRKDDWGSIAIKDNDIGFAGTPEGYDLKVHNGDFHLEAKLTPWTDLLSRISPTGRDFWRNLGYRMFKIKGMRVAGTVDHNGEQETLSGTAYFQRVRISSPTTPWFWGIFQSERGDFIDYFMPNLSPELLRRRHSERSILGGPRLPLMASIAYMDGETGQHYDFKMKVRKGWDEQGRAKFHVHGEGFKDTVGSIDLRIQTYQRATWRIQQPWLGALSTVLHYNEYPAQLVDCKIKVEGKTIDREALGRVVGNVEHAWGVV